MEQIYMTCSQHFCCAVYFVSAATFTDCTSSPIQTCVHESEKENSVHNMPIWKDRYSKSFFRL